MNIYSTQFNTPYIYRLTDNTGKWYIGSRTIKNCHPDELGIKYFSSSKIVEPMFKENISEWKKEILYIGKEQEDVEELEGLILLVLDAKNSTMSYNMHNNSLYNVDWNCSKAGKLGIQKMTTEQRRNGGLKNVSTGHLSNIASSGGTAYAINRMNNKDFDKILTDKFISTAKKNGKCIYCNIETNLGNLKRWHGNNCKSKE
jgi:hypothetical protein